MKYRKATDVLPDELLKEVQKYVNGEALYFPKHRERKNWGEVTGAKDFYVQRNTAIRKKYKQHIALEDIASEYNLSIESIKKIIYVRSK